MNLNKLSKKNEFTKQNKSFFQQQLKWKSIKNTFRVKKCPWVRRLKEKDALPFSSLS